MSSCLQWERFNRINQIIQGRGIVTRERLAEKLEVNVRTIQRDLNDLRDRFGAPLAYSRSKGLHYTESGWVLPAIALQERELFSLLIAQQAVMQYRGTPLAKRLKQIFNKIAGSLSDTIHVHPDYPAAGILSFAPAPVLDVDEKLWNNLLVAIRNQKSAYITYHSRSSKELSERQIDPCHILNMQGDWYLYAYDHLRKRVSQFQLHRIKAIKLLEERFEKPEGFDISAIANSSFGSFGSVEKMKNVRLRITGDMRELLADRQFHPRQTIKERTDGFEISFPVSSAGRRPFYNLIQWILSMGRDVEILAPKQLKDLVYEEILHMKNNAEK